MTMISLLCISILALAETSKISFDDIKNGDVIKITQAINDGADVNKPDENGWTPLMLAAYSGNKDIVKLLIDKGASINMKNTVGITPLLAATTFPASRKYAVEVVKLLLENGADINSENNEGKTPMKNAFYCSHKNCSKIVELLKQYGAVEPTGVEPKESNLYLIKGNYIKIIVPEGWKRFREEMETSLNFSPSDKKDVKFSLSVLGSYKLPDIKESETTRIIEKREVMFLNAPASSVEYVDIKNGRKGKIIEFYKNNTYLAILFAAKTEDYDTLLPSIEASLTTLEVN